MPDLPLELIEEVVEHIGRTHRKTLKAASVSARCFLVPCQKALFSHIGLRWGGPNSPGKRLLHTLQVSPHLATYVRNLGIFDDNGDEDEYVGQGEEWQCTHMDWLPRDQDAADLLEFLAGLGQLTEFQCWLSRKAEYWDSLPTKTKTSIVSLCSAPSLSRLVVKSVPLLLVDFKAGPTLEDMQVRFDDQGYYVSKPTPSTYPLVKLQSLTLLGNEEALDYAVGRIDMAHLRQLKIIEDMMGEPELGRVLPLCRSLETLVTPSSALLSRSVPHPVSLSPLTNLTYLRLVITDVQEEGPDPRLSMLLYSLLDTFQTPNLLRTIVIESPFQTALEFLMWREDRSDPAWECADKLLSNAQRFPELRTIEIRIESFDLNAEELAAETLVIRNAFSECHQAGLVIAVSGLSTSDILDGIHYLCYL